MNPGAGIPIGSLPNLRDLGGWTAKGGTVRYGLAYRSTALDQLTDDDLPAFVKLGVRTVYDLRTQSERDAEPDRAVDGAENVVVDVLSDSKQSAPARLLEVLHDPEAAAEMLGSGRAVRLFEHGYREAVNLPSARAGYHVLFTGLADRKRRPALFHCTTGKDRTGWAAAVLLMVLGVSDRNVMDDYLLTNDQLLPALQPVLDKFAAAGGDPELLRPVIGVQKEYLEASLDEMEQRFGTLDGYLSKGLNLDDDALAGLTAAFVENGHRKDMS